MGFLMINECEIAGKDRKSQILSFSYSQNFDFSIKILDAPKEMYDPYNSYCMTPGITFLEKTAIELLKSGIIALKNFTKKSIDFYLLQISKKTLKLEISPLNNSLDLKALGYDKETSIKCDDHLLQINYR